MSDVLSVDVSQVPFAVHEAMGPLCVWYGSVLLAELPWHTYSHVDEKGNLHILDLISRRWLPKEWERGSWTEVNRQPAPAVLRPRT